MILYNFCLKLILYIIAGIIGWIVLYQFLSRLHPSFRSESYQGNIFKITFKNQTNYDTKNKIKIILLKNVQYISSCPIPSKLEKGCWTLIWEGFPVKKRNSNSISLKVRMGEKNELIEKENIYIEKSNQLEVPIDHEISPPKDRYIWRGALEKIGIALSRNVFPITWGIVFVVFLTLVYLLLTPPIQIVLLPSMISENMSSGDVLLETISIKNLGADITSAKFDVNGAAQIVDLNDVENVTLTNILNNLSENIKSLKEIPQFTDNTDLNNAEDIAQKLVLSKDEMTTRAKEYNDYLLNYQNNTTLISENIKRLEDMYTNDEQNRTGFNNNIKNIKNNISAMDKIISTGKNISIVILGNNPDTDMLFNGDIRFYHLQIAAPDSPGEFRGEISITAKSNNYQKVEKIPVDIIVE